MAQTPQQALNNVITALTGNDALNAGVFVGTYQRHAALQEALEVLTELVKQYKPAGPASPPTQP